MENNMKSASHTLSHREDKPKTFRVLLSITTEEDERLVAETFRAHHVPLIAEIRGKGTAPSEFLDILGLGGSTRILTFGCVPTQQVPELFSAMKQTLSYHRRGTGIALTLPLSGAQKALVQLLNIPAQSKEEIPMSDQQSNAPAYSMILVSVNAGYSENVIEAARTVGAKGGTVVHGRRIAGNAGPYLGIDGPEEQDFVMIVVPEEKKTAVMQAITASCGLNSPARGVILSVPVDEVMGLV